MRSFQQKKGWRHIFESMPVVIFLGILVLIFAWGVFGFWGKMRETSLNRKIIEDKIVELQKEKEKLTENISKLKTDEGVEENIREKFGLAKEGEEMIVVVENKDTSTVPLDANSGGFFSFFSDWFK